MISAKQKPYKTPISSGGGDGPFALFQQNWQPVFADAWLPPWVTFGEGNLTKCYGYCAVGTFTAEVYIDGTLVFTVSDADDTTPVDLEIGEDGLLADPSLITCKVTVASSDVSGIVIEAVSA
jgi:hypothetical protein